MTSSSDELDEAPTTANFRRNMDAYVRAANEGRLFRLHRYHRPIGFLGPADRIPARFTPRARRIAFSEARRSLPSITSTMMRGRAIIITKLRVRHAIRGDNRGGARAPIDFAAIWPLPEDALISGIVGQLEKLGAEQRKTATLLSSLVKRVQPIFDKLVELRFINDEIAEKRKLLDNLTATEQRVRSGRPLQNPG